MDDHDIFKGSLTSKKISDITGQSDLSKIETLEIKIDTRVETGIGNIGTLFVIIQGKWLENLSYLKLNNSFVPSIRDLGTGYSCLKILWMPRCNLVGLDGLGSLSSLRELYLAFNQIKILDPISMLENLEVLDIEGNLVSDMDQIEYLVFCPNLKSLTLLDNPINYDSIIQEEKTADARLRNRHIVSTLIPQLEILDDLPLDQIENNQDSEVKENIKKPILKRPNSVSSIKRPTPPISSIISTKQISILRARVQARLATQSKRLVNFDIPETDKSPKLKTKTPMPPIKSSQSFQSFAVPVPPSNKRPQSYRQHARFSVASS